MVDSLTLWEAQNHKIKLIEEDGTEHIGIADFYENEYDSGYGVAGIGIKGDLCFRADEIQSIEILD